MLTPVTKIVTTVGNQVDTYYIIEIGDVARDALFKVLNPRSLGIMVDNTLDFHSTKERQNSALCFSGGYFSWNRLMPNVTRVKEARDKGKANEVILVMNNKGEKSRRFYGRLPCRHGYIN
ncbi:hypothetical protein V6N11_066685 [Hibiscus sabdariffa]|uniref:Uncharacterized protein n=2 Tax=Hibiscus sabdariffa TaxID=183260 RepID=A0ABR2C9N0_9ROSI